MVVQSADRGASSHVDIHHRARLAAMFASDRSKRASLKNGLPDESA
jgi:hypothetical protein